MNGDLKIECPLCSSENIRQDVSSVDSVWPERYGVSLCSDCGLFFLEKMPTEKVIEEYYKNNYHLYSPIISFIKSIFRRFRCSSQFDYIIKEIGNLSGQNILEIGASDGMLIGHFSGNRLTGTEYNKRFKDQAFRRYGVDLIDKNIFELGGEFDLILMSHVIEHFSDIERVIGVLRTLLIKDGFLFIEVPNSPKYGFYGNEELKAYLSTPHTYNFSTKSILSLAKKMNMEVRSLKRFYYRFPRQYPSEKRKGLARLFLEGSSCFELSLIGGAVRYIFSSFFDPRRSYVDVPVDAEYLGLGDNIRVILQICQ